MLKVRGLTVEYVDGEEIIRPLNDFGLEARDGEMLLLLGPSGSGKTTLLSCLAGLLTPTSGSISVGGSEVLGFTRDERDHYRRHTVGVCFQAFNLIASLTARENVMVPLRLAGHKKAAARQRAEELLEQVGLGHRITHRPAALSGGQQQRVAIARALALDPPLILADEPTAHLDVVQVDGVISLLRSLAAPGRTVVIATHDDRILPVADRAVELGAHAASAELKTRALRAGELVFEEGDHGQAVFVIASGQVQIFRTLSDGSEEQVNVLGPGAHFGEIGPLLGLPRTASARAVSGTVLVVHDVRDFRLRAGRRDRERSRAAVTGELRAMPDAEITEP